MVRLNLQICTTGCIKMSPIIFPIRSTLTNYHSRLRSLWCKTSFNENRNKLNFQHFVRLFEQHKTDEELLIELLPILANFLLFFCPSKNELIQLYLNDMTSMLISEQTKPPVISLGKIFNFMRRVEVKVPVKVSCKASC